MVIERTKLNKLKTAFLEVECFRVRSKREVILAELNEDYPTILIEDPDPTTLIHKLIRKCEQYEGALPCLISIMDETYEKNSIPMTNLKQLYLEVSTPSPERPRLEKKFNQYVIHIVEIDETHYIPLKFSELTDILLANTIIYTWKQIHTLCEVLVTDFMPTYKHIMNEQVPLAKTSIENFKPKCGKFADGLASLDQTIFSFDRIESLKEIPYCIEPLLETMNYPPKTDYFILGQELAEHIINLLLEALRLADRILDSYLSPPTGT